MGEGEEGEGTPCRPAAVGSCFRRNDEVGGGSDGRGGGSGLGRKMGSRLRGSKRGWATTRDCPYMGGCWNWGGTPISIFPH